MKIYTLTGDDGTTSLSGGRRVPKDSIRIEAYGSVDELIAWFGLLRDHKENLKRKEILIYIQNQLMLCTAALAYDCENINSRKILLLTPLVSFILPGGNLLVSYCHIARCVCRRAERAVLRLNHDEESPEIVNKFLNRLSDYLFVLSRVVGLELDIEEIKWSV
jgi:cob(I)alamin adenosyltransferase